MAQTTRRILVAATAAISALAAFALVQGGAEPARPVPDQERAKLGLMTSLPIYWAEGADIAALVDQDAKTPWQREALEQQFELLPLDALASDGPETDPIDGLEFIAVIQPRGLSPADNVALDEWVRAGGKLLLVLDPMLTGEYEMPLGDPRRPVDTALIPPVVKRWGLDIQFAIHEVWENGIVDVALEGESFTVSHGGQIVVADPSDADCELHAAGVIAQCQVGDGRVTLLADAVLFEERELAGEGGHKLLKIFEFAIE